MTQEDKTLLLRDLCSRLPYGVKISVQSWDEREMEYVDRVDVLYSVNGDEYIKSTNEDYDFSLEDIKPYLYPLSSMTEEQKEELNRVTNGKFNSCGTYIDNCKPRNWSEWGTTEYNWIRHHDVDLLHTWLNKKYFDYRGLIERGLAIDATGLNIY